MTATQIKARFRVSLGWIYAGDPAGLPEEFVAFVRSDESDAPSR